MWERVEGCICAVMAIGFQTVVILAAFVWVVVLPPLGFLWLVGAI